MQQSLTFDKGFSKEGFEVNRGPAEEKFAVDRSFVVFLLAMILLFVLFGMIANPGSFVPPDYQIFW